MIKKDAALRGSFRGEPHPNLKRDEAFSCCSQKEEAPSQNALSFHCN
jgi:hypothetical protein